MRFTQQIASQSPVPEWFFTARKQGKGDDELIARIRDELAQAAGQYAREPVLWDSAFLDHMAAVVFSTYVKWMKA